MPDYNYGVAYSYCDRPCTTTYIDPGPHIPSWCESASQGCDTEPQVFDHACVFPLTGTGSCQWTSLFKAPCDCNEFLDGTPHNPPFNDDSVACDAARCGSNSVWNGCTAVGATSCAFNATVGFCHRTAAKWDCPPPKAVVPQPPPVVHTTTAVPVDPGPVVVDHTSQANDGNTPQKPAPTDVPPQGQGQGQTGSQTTSAVDQQPGNPQPNANGGGQSPPDQSNGNNIIATTSTVATDQTPSGTQLPGPGNGQSPGSTNLNGSGGGSGGGSSGGDQMMNGNTGTSGGAPVAKPGPNNIKPLSGNPSASSTTAGPLNATMQKLAGQNSGSSGISGGLIGGIVAGAVTIIAVIVLIVILIRRSRKNKSGEAFSEMPSSDFYSVQYAAFRQNQGETRNAFRADAAIGTDAAFFRPEAAAAIRPVAPAAIRAVAETIPTTDKPKGKLVELGVQSAYISGPQYPRESVFLPSYDMVESSEGSETTYDVDSYNKGGKDNYEKKGVERHGR